MKKIHQNAINYVTYLVLNKRKLDNKQNPIAPLNNKFQKNYLLTLEPTSQKRDNPLCHSTTCRVWHLDNGLNFMPVQCMSVIFLFFIFLRGAYRKLPSEKPRQGWLGFVALTKNHPSKISWMKWLQ